MRNLAIVAFLALSAHAAEAHFVLMTPQSWAQQDGYGLPEKSAPCGQADPGTTAVPTNAVTGYKIGDTITITVNEAIFHPGHYRVALATDMASLPAEPAVTVGSTPCGSAAIESPATFPVLADDMLDHTAPFSAAQSFQVQLPAGMMCSHCVLQVIEFMSDHPLNNPGGCFYHHCANVAITAQGGDAGVTPPDAPVGGGGHHSGCSAAGGGGLGLVVLVLGLVCLRRRARR
jgi:hypothetical protein